MRIFLQEIALRCLMCLYCVCTPGQPRPPGNLRITPMQRTLALEIYFDPNPTFMMEQVNVTETQNMEVTMKKGFLESS